MRAGGITAAATTTTGTTFLSAAPATSLRFALSKKLPQINRRLSFAGTISPGKLIPPLRSSSSASSSSTPIVDEKEENTVSSSPDSLLVESESIASQDFSSIPPLRGCKGCGREEIEKGCNSEGRIQGGIATVPGFGWWPIKAYRPCPAFVASGGRYRRQGQNMDEVASGSGRRRRVAPAETKNKSQSR